MRQDKFPETVAVRITAVSPENAFPGDTILIKGGGFKSKEATVVIFPDSSLGRIIDIAVDYIKVIVPRKQDISGNIKVRTGANNYATTAFTILPYPAPVLKATSLKQGPMGTPIVAEGDFISEVLEVSDKPSDIAKTKVLVGGREAEVDSLSFTKVWFKIPQGLGAGKVSISVVRDGKNSEPLDFFIDKYFLFEDDFQQEDIQSRKWKILTGAWNISTSGESKFLESATGNNISIINTHLRTQIDDNSDFFISGMTYVKGTIANAWSGIVFHAQDDKNFYVLRISGVGVLQLIRIVNGSASLVVQNTSQAARLQGENFYKIEVTGLAPYKFSVRVLSTEGEEILNLPSVIDAQAMFNGGYAGFYSTSGSGGRFDNFIMKSNELTDE